MKFSVNRKNLLEGLKLVSGAVATRATLPVLNHVMLKAEAAGLKLLANNLELMLVVNVSAEIELIGAICLPHKLLQEVVMALAASDDDLVSFELDESSRRVPTVIVRHGTAVVELKGIEGDEMPMMLLAVTDALSEHLLATSWLLPALRSVMFAAATDDTRPTFMGVQWVVKNGQSEMAGTDGFRLGYRNEPYPAEGEFSLLLVAKRAALLLDALEATGEHVVTMTVNCNMVRFEAGAVTGFMQLMDSKYPDYKPIIPPRTTMGLEADKASLLQAVQLAKVIAQSDRQQQLVRLSVDGDVLSIAATQSGIGSNRAKCSPVVVTGEAIDDVGMNCQFLIDGLAHVAGERVLMQFTDPKEPIVIRDDANSVWRYVVMPVYLSR